MNGKDFRDFIRRHANSTNLSPLLVRFFKWLDAATADYTNAQALGFWIAAALVGVAAVAYASAFRIVEHFVENYVATNPVALFAFAPFAIVVAWWLVARYSPEASGSGIPQVLAAIDTEYEGRNRPFVDRLMGLRAAVVKVFSSLLCLAGAGAIGREGPTLQISSAIFHFVGQKVRRFYPNADEKTWLITGAAAGLASAFNTPLGGIVYAIEELSLHHFYRARTALFTAVIISGLVAQGFLGSYLYLGFPPMKPLAWSQWPLIFLVAFVTGASGALFSKTLYALSAKRKAIKSFKKSALVALVCGFGVAGLVYFDHRNSGPGSALISSILFGGEAASFKIIFGRMLSTGLAYLSGAAGGVFAPSLTIGAAIGSKLAYLLSSPNTALLAMLGMIGFLTGVTHTPFTSFILVMEMSDRHSAVFPMMLTALVATSVAKSIDSKSFYERLRDEWLSKNQIPQNPAPAAAT